jgi:phosphoglycolate phosphatase
MKLKPAAILFDLDGVLVDSLDAWWHALNQALEHYHHPTLSKTTFIEQYWGHDLHDILKTMKLNPDIATFCNNAYQNFINKITIFDDTYTVLQSLNQYPKALITNTPANCTHQILKKYAIEPYFITVITSNDVTKAKPAPEPILKACKQLHVQPKDTLLIGDTKSDILAGKTAGCTVIGINIPADYTIHHLKELLNFIK